MTMKSVVFLSFLFILNCLIYTVVSQNDGQPDFNKLRVKELKALLEERGVECNGCAEKSHLVERVKETYSLPIIPAEERKTKDKKSGKSEKAKNENADMSPDVQKLLEELKKRGGFETSKLFTGEDLKKFNVDKKFMNEDEL